MYNIRTAGLVLALATSILAGIYDDTAVVTAEQKLVQRREPGVNMNLPSKFLRRHTPGDGMPMPPQLVERHTPGDGMPMPPQLVQRHTPGDGMPMPPQLVQRHTPGDGMPMPPPKINRRQPHGPNENDAHFSYPVDRSLNLEPGTVSQKIDGSVYEKVDNK
jgi:hypothetical protein